MSHWCKSVIDEVIPVQSFGSLSAVSANTFPPPPPVPPRVKLTVPTQVQYSPAFEREQLCPISQPIYPVPVHLSQPQWIGAMNNTSSTSIGAPVAPTLSTSQILTTGAKRVNPSRFHPLVSPQAPPAAEKVSTASPAVGWPPSLNSFVIRAFTNCQSALDRELMTAKLEKIISRVTSEGKLQTHNWNVEPTPSLAPNTQNIDNSAVIMNSFHSGIEPVESLKSKRRKVEVVDAAPKANTTIADDKLLKARANRFKAEVEAISSEKASHKKRPESNGEDFDTTKLIVIGTCQKLEKEYFRLTSAPEPSVVRPENVLRAALNALKKKWRSNSVEYLYMCSQLKAIRQDLTVQHIQTEFTVEVYETHARIALECDDLNEYNQCQTQLKHLYDSNVPGSEPEFVAYRILYYVYLLGNKKYQKGSFDLAFAMTAISRRYNIYRDGAVQHALRVRRAVQQENYHDFFRLCREVPNMGLCILKPMFDTLRLSALQRICRSYKPTVPIDFVINELGFDDIATGKHFLETAGCKITNEVDTLIINTSETVIDASAVHTQDKLLL